MHFNISSNAAPKNYAPASPELRFEPGQGPDRARPMPQGRISEQSMQLRGKRFVNDKFILNLSKTYCAAQHNP
jgi:hypothetical protein